MPREIHVFRTPDCFIVGAIGQPGNRTFYLQVSDHQHVMSVTLEKQQVAILADRIGALLTEVNRRFGTPIPPQPSEDTHLPSLITPLQSQFGVGAMGLGWDAEASIVVIELLAATQGDFDASVVLDDTEEGPDAIRVFLSPESAQQFVSNAYRVISSGWPPCPLCDEPLDPGGHICVRTNGYRRGVFPGISPHHLDPS